MEPFNRKRIIYFTYLDPNIVLTTIHIERLRYKISDLSPDSSTVLRSSAVVPRNLFWIKDDKLDSGLINQLSRGLLRERPNPLLSEFIHTRLLLLLLLLLSPSSHRTKDASTGNGGWSVLSNPTEYFSNTFLFYFLFFFFFFLVRSFCFASPFFPLSEVYASFPLEPRDA